MSEEREIPELSSYMTQAQTGPRADRRQINIAFVDDAANLHPSGDVCRQGEMIPLIDWLDHGFEPNDTSPSETQRANYWEKRAVEMTALVTEDTTFYVELDESRRNMFRTLIETGASLEAIQRLAGFTISALELPVRLKFVPWATYVRIGNVSKFVTHKTIDTHQL